MQLSINRTPFPILIKSEADPFRRDSRHFIRVQSPQYRVGLNMNQGLETLAVVLGIASATDKSNILGKVNVIIRFFEGSTKMWIFWRATCPFTQSCHRPRTMKVDLFGFCIDHLNRTNRAELLQGRNLNIFHFQGNVATKCGGHLLVTQGGIQ